VAKIKWPVGPADELVNTETTTGETFTIDNVMTLLVLSGLTGAFDIDLDISEELPVGAQLYVKAIQGATGRNVTLGDGFSSHAADLTGVANDVDVREFVYDGTEFQPKGLWAKVVDAA
jgi:hypothetical protein